MEKRRFLDFLDMIDGGGAGAMGDKFEGGGLLSSFANALADPYGSQDPERMAARKAFYSSDNIGGDPMDAPVQAFPNYTPPSRSSEYQPADAPNYDPTGHWRGDHLVSARSSEYQPADAPNYDPTGHWRGDHLVPARSPEYHPLEAPNYGPTVQHDLVPGQVRRRNPDVQLAVSPMRDSYIHQLTPSLMPMTSVPDAAYGGPGEIMDLPAPLADLSFEEFIKLYMSDYGSPYPTGGEM